MPDECPLIGTDADGVVKTIFTVNQDARPEGQGIDMLVLHYTGMPSADAALARMTDPEAQVSAHWMVQEDGALVALVPENRRAWHAGVSFWRGERAINARSIGVEIVNPGHEFGYRPFPEPQMKAVIALCQGILRRHPGITPWNVVAHADIAPTRKEDPGELFDWASLAAAGIGVWPEAAAVAARRPWAQGRGMADALPLLAALGYDTTHPDATVRAFQRRFHPESVTGVADPETLARLAALSG